MAPIAPRLVRPLLAGALAGGVAFGLRLVVGPNAFVQLAIAGTGGLLVYLALAVRRDELRTWIAAIRPGKAQAA